MLDTPRIALKVARVRAGLRQYRLAELIGVSRQSLCLYEAGKLSPGPRTRAELVRVLGVPEPELFPELEAAELAAPV